jgi:PHD/YefM family antitoxin component YafN of YafNO toxin-antitoxin module
MIAISQQQLGGEFVNALDGLTMQETLLIDLNGKKFVVLKEEDYQGWLETVYLLSSSKNAQVLQNAMEQPLSECRDLKDVLRELDTQADPAS